MTMTDRAGERPAAGAMLAWWFGGSLLGPMRAMLGAVIVAAGPWLVSAAALAVVSVALQPALGIGPVEDLRLTVVYAFCLAPLIAGPVGVVAARLVAQEAEAGAIRQAPAIFLAAALASGLMSQVLALGLVVALGLAPLGVSSGLVFLTGAAAPLWTSFAVLAALKAYMFLIQAFTGSMTFSLACIMLAGRGEIGTEILIWSFTAGIVLCVCLSAVRIGRMGVAEEGDLVAAARALWREGRRLLPLAAGVFCAISAVWIDKWVYWIGAGAARSEAGFLHYSAYDSVMFIAHISAIPSYAAMLLFHDGDLRTGVEAFRARLRDGSTHARIRRSIETLSNVIWSGVFSIVFLQAALTACMVLIAPALAKALDFSFDQFLTLRVGLIAVFLHAFFYLSCAVILLCNRARLFFALQAAFFTLNLGFSLGFLNWLGMTAYAFFVSALVMAVVAFFVAFRTLASFDYLTFLGENDSLYAS